jgi:hypothetical protein
MLLSSMSCIAACGLSPLKMPAQAIRKVIRVCGRPACHPGKRISRARIADFRLCSHQHAIIAGNALGAQELATSTMSGGNSVQLAQLRSSLADHARIGEMRLNRTLGVLDQSSTRTSVEGKL